MHSVAVGMHNLLHRHKRLYSKCKTF